MNIIKKFTRNTAGRDFAVGDIHGHFSRLQAALDAIGFDPATDRLFSVGDLVDRGPESERVLEWLAKPWFQAVRGNHEQMLAMATAQAIDDELYIFNGGAWFLSLPDSCMIDYEIELSSLPMMIEVETESGPVGIVHADCDLYGWKYTEECLGSEDCAAHFKRQLESHMLWGRERIKNEDRSGVHDLRAMIVGHTQVRTPVVLGNVWHIDTGGWLPDGSGYFTLLDLSTLQASPTPVSAKLEWNDD